MIQTTKKLRITPFFKWYDMWIGLYIDQAKAAVYICPLPMIGVRIWYEDTAVCDRCDEPAVKIAGDIGDQWFLEWTCKNPDCWNYQDVIEYIPWPFGDNWISANDLIELGYEVV